MPRVKRSIQRRATNSYSRSKRIRTTFIDHAISVSDSSNLSSDSDSDSTIIESCHDNADETEIEEIPLPLDGQSGPDFELVLVFFAEIISSCNLPALTIKKIFSALERINKHKRSTPTYRDYTAFMQKCNIIKTTSFVYSCETKTLVRSIETLCCEHYHGALKVFDIYDSICVLFQNNASLRHQDDITTGNKSAFLHSKKYGDLWKDFDLLQQKFSLRIHRVTLLINLDDASMLSTSEYVTTPLTFTVAELPPKIRCAKINVMMAALWFGKERIKYDEIYLNGLFKYIDKYRNSPMSLVVGHRHYNVIIRVGAVILDSVAKYKSLNHVSYFAEYGCPYCFIQCESRRDHTFTNHRVYLFSRHCVPEKKSQSFYLEAGSIAETTNKPQRGLYGKSVLSQYCNVPGDIVIDYMHSVLEGNLKTLLSDRPFSNESAVKHINRCAGLISIPHEFTRKFRSISMVSKWRAHELKMFLLYLIPLYRNVIDADNFILILSLSAIVRLLCANNISENDLRQCNDMIMLFLEAYQELKGEWKMRFNLHLLSHLAEQISHYGNVMEMSSFVYESNIYQRKKSFHGTRGHLNQMSDNYVKEKGMNSVAVARKNDLQNYFAYEKLKRSKEYHIIEPAQTMRPIDASILKLLKRRYGWLSDNDVKIFTRLQKNHVIYHSLIYPHRQQSASFYIYFNTMASRTLSFGKVHYFVGIPQRRSCNNITTLFAVFTPLFVYERKNILTGIERANNSKIRELSQYHDVKKCFSRLKLGQKIDIMDFSLVEGKAFVFQDPSEVSIFWGSKMLEIYEHD